MHSTDVPFSRVAVLVYRLALFNSFFGFRCFHKLIDPGRRLSLPQKKNNCLIIPIMHFFTIFVNFSYLWLVVPTDFIDFLRTYLS